MELKNAKIADSYFNYQAVNILVLYISDSKIAK